MLLGSIRNEAEAVRHAQRRLPERLPQPWRIALTGADVVAVLAACYAATLPLAVAPAVCAIVWSVFALCGLYRHSYAVAWYDEFYHVVVGCVLAAVPLWVVVHLIAALPSGLVLVILGCSVAFAGFVHAALNAARHAGEPAPRAGSRCVFPEAQWNVRHTTYGVWKLAFDVSLSVAGLIVCSPVMALAALAIVLESGRPVFFRQERVGRDGIRFSIFKFRTMHMRAGADWARRNDPRITRVGAFLRRFSIDELPQLINVLCGEMSLVGPRPEMDAFARRFAAEVPHYDERHIVAPGLTGWAQVQLERNLRPDDVTVVLPYDLFYVNNASPVLDGIVVIKTAVEFAFHRGV